MARELENEGISWSNKKVKRVADALKTVLIAYLAAYAPEQTNQAKEQLVEEITNRSAIQKADLVEGLAAAIDVEAAEAHSFNTVTSLMRLQ